MEKPTHDTSQKNSEIKKKNKNKSQALPDIKT